MTNTPMPCPLAAPCSPHSPGLLGEPGPVCVQEVGSGLQGPPVVLREQGPPGRGGVVSVGGVSVLQRGELVLPQHLEGHEVPGRDNSWGPNVLAQRPWSWAGEGQARVTVTKCVWGSVLQAAGQGGPHRHHGGLFLRPQVASSPPFPPATPPELGTPEWGPNTLEPSATLPGNSFPAPGQRQVVAQAQPQGSDCPSSRGSPPGPAPSGLLALRPACSPPAPAKGLSHWEAPTSTPLPGCASEPTAKAGVGRRAKQRTLRTWQTGARQTQTSPSLSRWARAALLESPPRPRRGPSSQLHVASARAPTPWGAGDKGREHAVQTGQLTAAPCLSAAGAGGRQTPGTEQRAEACLGEGRARSCTTSPIPAQARWQPASHRLEVVPVGKTTPPERGPSQGGHRALHQLPGGSCVDASPFLHPSPESLPSSDLPGWPGGHLPCTPSDPLEEVSREEVVADVARVVEQAPAGCAPSRRLGADLAVLHHLGDAVHLAHDAHGLLGVGLLHHLPPPREG